jgi:poly(A) polymerase
VLRDWFSPVRPQTWKKGCAASPAPRPELAPTIAMSAQAQLPDPNFLHEPRLSRLLGVLDGRGEETRVIGGAVRNAMLGFAAGDVDLATTALPQVVIARVEADGMRAVPTGLAHGTITVVVDGHPFEVTTLREDVETDGRRARVVFGRDFAHDARRRDFTVNALSANAQGEVFDYVAGLDDLSQGRIRFIGTARARIREDYLRVLRFFRFHAAYGRGGLDEEGFAAVIAERAGLEQLSRERIRAEVLKLLVARRAPEVVAIMSDAGLFASLRAGIAHKARFARLALIEAASAMPADPLLRLGAVAVQTVEDAQRLRERLRLSNEEYERLANAATVLAGLHGSDHPPEPRQLREMLFRHGRGITTDALMLAQAEASVAADDAQWLSARRFVADTPTPTLPFSGADVVARGVPSGRLVGDILKRLQALWIRAGFPKDPATLVKLLDDAITKETRS